jgi:hypothetical protein
MSAVVLGVPDMVVQWIVPSFNSMPMKSPFVIVTVVPGKVVVSVFDVMLRVVWLDASSALNVVRPYVTAALASVEAGPTR